MTTAYPTVVRWGTRRSRYTGKILERRTAVRRRDLPIVYVVVWQWPGDNRHATWEVDVYRGSTMKEAEGRHFFPTLTKAMAWVQEVVDTTNGDVFPALKLGRGVDDDERR